MQPSPILREIVSGWFEAAAKGDAAWRDRHVSRDPALRIVGTDREEWLQGREAYRFLKDEAETVGGRISVKVLEVEAYEEGGVGWGLALPEITLSDGSRVTPRWSAVFRRETEGWKLIQLHASIAQANAEAFGDIFTR